jgi:antitoxin component of RelBE/YafQ-DinJ toxin-antitoxin module
MVLKTFSVKEETYDKFYNLCQDYGLNMSRQIELFMESMIKDEPEPKKEYVAKLEKIRKGKFVPVKSFADRYKL